MWPKLTVLQSRLLGSALALLLIIALYFSISSRTFAYAQEIETIPSEYEHDDFVLTQYTLNDDLEIEGEKLRVEDDGTGIEDIEKAREPFFTTKSNEEFLERMKIFFKNKK